MSLRFIATETFWRKFYALPDEQKQRIRELWKIFKVNQRDLRLRTHKINEFSGPGRTVYAVVVEGKLRILFFYDGNTVVTADLGTNLYEH